MDNVENNQFRYEYPYQSAVPTANVAVSTAEFLYLEPDGKVCYEHSYKKALAERRVKLAEKSQNLSPIHGRGELCSPAGDRRSPLRIKMLRCKQISNPGRF